MRLSKHISIALCALSMLSGCATFQPEPLGMTEPVESRSETKSRKKATWITVGALVLLGAVIVHEGQDGVQDAVRDVNLP